MEFPDGGDRVGRSEHYYTSLSRVTRDDNSYTFPGGVVGYVFTEGLFGV